MALALSLTKLSGQDKNDRFRFNSFSFSLGGSNTSIFNGFASSAELGFSKGEHLFKAYRGRVTSIAINIFGGENEPNIFDEYSVMYGKEFGSKKWVSIDLFAGLSYNKFKYKPKNEISISSDFIKRSSIGLPMQAKLRFLPKSFISIGIEQHININSEEPVSRTSLFLQINF